MPLPVRLLLFPLCKLTMTRKHGARFHGALDNVLSQLTQQQQLEGEANIAATSAIRDQKTFDGPVSSSVRKRELIDVGYNAKKKHCERRLLLKDPDQIGLGNVLDGQTPLLRRDMFRRKLFPIRFEDSARNVEEVQQLLMKRQSVAQLVISLLYLAMLLLFLSHALEITKVFETTDGIASPLNSALAPTVSSFNSISYKVAKAEQISSAAPAAVVQDSGTSESILTLKSKAGVASWLLYGFIPLLYGPSSQTSNLGSARIVGNCFRLTFRQVELENVDGFDLGYDGIWPITTAGAASRIAAARLRSDNPLVNPSGSRFTYSYPFAAVGDDKAFNKIGGHYQVICEDSMQAAQNALQQNQAPSRYPPWFVPLPVIADRRTISTVVDFFAINPITETFAHCAVLFAFTSSGTVQRPLVLVSSLMPFSAQSYGLVRYTSLGLMLTFLLLYLLCEFVEMKRLGFKSWLKGGWTIFLLFHLFVLLGFLSSFSASQVIALLAPEIGTTIGVDGYYNTLEAPRAASESEFFQLVNSYYNLFSANDVSQQACIIFGSVTALSGCVLITRLIPATAGIGTKSLQMTFRKVKFYILASSLGMLAIVLVFVSLGNISFGTATRSFAGYYESLTTSAALLLGGTVGNYNLYMMTSVNPVLAGVFFVPLFLVFSAFGFTIVTAVVLRKHDFCAESVQQGVIKYRLEGQQVFRTRYEWLVHNVKYGCLAFWKAMIGFWRAQTVALPADGANYGLDDDVEEARELKSKRKVKRRSALANKKKGEDFYRREHNEEEEPSSIEADNASPPYYPPWVWSAIGMQDPRDKYGLQTGEGQGFYVDPGSIGTYSRTYGCFSGFNVSSVTDRSNWYFTPVIPCTQVAEYPAPSIAKVYVMVRKQTQEDHEDAWKKLFVIAFVAVIVATVSLQLSVDVTADMREMSGKAISKTEFPSDPIEFTCKDPSLGLPDINAKIVIPSQHLFSVNSSKALYSWLQADSGLMGLLASTPTAAISDEVFPRLTMSGATYQQLVLSNWNSAIIPRSVRVTLALRCEVGYPAQVGFTCESLQCNYQPLFETTAFRAFLKELAHQDILRDVVEELAFYAVLVNPNADNMVLELSIKFRRDRGGTVVPSLCVEAYELQPYATWHSTAIASIALQVAAVALFLFFGCSFFVELYRLRRNLKEERDDYSFGLCLGVFFVDDIFNVFDLIGFGVLAGSIVVWALHVLALTHFQVFNMTTDLATASAAAAAGGTQEAEATAAAGVLFTAISSTANSLRAYAQLAAAILAVAFLRLIRIGRKRKQLTLMFFALASAAEEMIQVLMGTTLVFIGFTYVCFLSFGRQLESYSTLRNSFVSTIMLTTGFFPLSQLFHADAIVAGAFIFPYLFFMGVICFSFFLCVLLRSLASRAAEIKAMERLGKVADRSVLESAQLFFAELFCRLGSKRARVQRQQQMQEQQRLKLQEDSNVHFGSATPTDKQENIAEVLKQEDAERRRREKPLKVVELPHDVVTSALSDEQYAALPEEVRLYAAQEAAFFIDRFRMMATQMSLGSGNIVSLLQQLESEAYAELSRLSRDVAQQEGHLRHELSVYASQVVSGQQRLTAYIKYIEKALKDREEELQLQQREVELLESRMAGDLE